MKVETAGQYYKDLNTWDATSRFYLDEIGVFEKRLNSVLKANTKRDVLAKAEQFQNQFILQREQFENILHDLKNEKKKVKSSILGKVPIVKTPLLKTDQLIQQRVEIAEKIFQETKRDFNRFLSEVL